MTDMLIKKGHINNDGIKEYIVFVLTLQYPSKPSRSQKKETMLTVRTFLAHQHVEVKINATL